MQSQRDGGYRFILNYQDHLTKFVCLRPLKTKTAEEVAYHLVDILCDKGAPHILQSDNGREFSNKVCSAVLGCEAGETSIVITSAFVKEVRFVQNLSNTLKIILYLKNLHFILMLFFSTVEYGSPRPVARVQISPWQATSFSVSRFCRKG